MKKINAAIILVSVIFVCILAGVNRSFEAWEHNMGESKEYLVELNRYREGVSFYEEQYGTTPELEQVEELLGISFRYILQTDIMPKEHALYTLSQSDIMADESYRIFISEKSCIKVLYKSEKNLSDIRVTVNAVLVLIFGLTVGLCLYVRQRILKPFHQISNLPEELAKGRLTKPLKEDGNRYFGKFIWGLDMLREELEKQKKRNLELERERKMLLLSLSHDIKTPLSAIRLYAQAIGKHLYKTEEKNVEISGRINDKVDEIQAYISEIVHASEEDIMDFTVTPGEVYAWDIFEEIVDYYGEKLALIGTKLDIQKGRNLLLLADRERLLEVVQNVFENAVKYGDGTWIQFTGECGETGEYIFYISNRGTPLSERDLLHIFDSFYRGSNVGKVEGSGLGLSICRNIVRKMNGEIFAVQDDEWFTVKIVLRRL